MRSTRWSRALTAAVAGIVVAFAPLARPRVTAQQPVFRAATDAVWVTATVVDKEGHLVTDLTKDDFEILDNGAPRPITVFRNDVVPFAIAVMVDISGSMIANTSLVRRGLSELVARFQPGDRARIGMFWGVTEMSPRFTANPQTLLTWVNATAGGAGIACTSAGQSRFVLAPRGAGTAMWDAIQCGIEAVSADAETPRRVVMVITDGMDHVSSATSSTVEQMAGEFGVMVYSVGMFGSEGLATEELRGIAEKTGGGYFHLEDREDLPATFARIADELRHQYIFGFAPTSSGTARHTIEVRTVRRNTTTRSRRVYMETTPAVAARDAAARAAPAPAPPSTPTGNAPRNTVESRLDQYSHGTWPAGMAAYASTADLWAAVRDLRAAAPDWIRAGGADQEVRRRLTVATYALDLIDRQGAAIWQPPISVSGVIEWASGLLREASPLPAERLWHLAGAAQLERLEPTHVLELGGGPQLNASNREATVSVGLDALTPHLKRAEQRFPEETRWVLVRAIAEELHTWPDARDDNRPDGVLTLPPDQTNRIVARYRDAATHDAVRQEAHLRWGYFELRRGHADAALTHLDLAGAPDDVVLRYWLHLFKGRAFEQLNRAADAIASYRLACADVPYAQSATLSLAAALVGNHQAAEASALVTRMMAIRPAPLDPWALYIYPDYRSWPAWIVELRRAIVQ